MLSHTAVCDSATHGLCPVRLLCSMQGLNLGLPHCRKTLYCLSEQGSPINIFLLNKEFVFSFVLPRVKKLNPKSILFP